MTEKLYIRYSTPADEQAVFAFYKDNDHPFVGGRDPEIWKERISSGAVTLIETVAGKIVASSISYPVMSNDENGNPVHRWTELGSTRVLPEVEGTGIFGIMLAAQVMRAYFFEPPEDRFAIEIDNPNIKSIRAFTREGCMPFSAPRELSAAADATLAPEDRGLPVTWLQISIESVPCFARKLQSAIDSPALPFRPGQTEYHVDFTKCVVVSTCENELRVVASCSYGDALKPDPGKKIKSVRGGPAP